MRRILALTLILVLVATACGSTEEEVPTLVPTVERSAEQPAPPTPDAGEAPTNTPQPTDTPPPTATAIPSPTPTRPEYLSGQYATVTNIVDGDTIDVEIDGQTYGLRYIGIDTSEQGELLVGQSAQANADLVAGQGVYLVSDVSDTDSFGRLLRYVYLEDGTFVNAELVRLGYAVAVAYPPDTRHHDEFVQLEQNARAAGRGMWAIPTSTAIPPTNTAAPPTNTPAAVTTAPPPTQPPAAGGQIIITNVNKRDEYVDLNNMGGQPVDISGWLLVSEKGNQTCTLGGVIQPGATLRVWALASDTGQGGFNCGFGNPIWNNSDPDPAVLYDSSGNLVDRYP